MDIQDLMSHFAVALGIGLLIGIERGWRTREEKPGSRTAGIRTFTIIGLLGGTIGVLAEATGTPLTIAGGIILGLGFAAFAVTFALMCRDENLADKSYSATTAIAGMLTFALSAYAMIGDMRVAAAGAVATVAILALRAPLHDWLTRISERELRSALILLAMTFIALPIIPDEPIGPFGGVNPREIWLIAIVLAAVSFAGYVAVKVLGARHGTMLAAAAGGLVSSTAVTASNARRAAAGEGSPRLLAAGVSLATAVSFARVIAIVAVLKPELLKLSAPALAAAILVASAFAVDRGLSGAAVTTSEDAERRIREPVRLLVGGRLRDPAGRDRAGRPGSRRKSRAPRARSSARWRSGSPMSMRSRCRCRG